MPFKKLHSLLVKSFLPPFVITLFVSVFLFFLVEIVITYLDDFIGKGLGFWTLSKLFFYAWLSIIPQCIPLAVLLASIMTFGSLAENYELAAMKSSGLSLFKIIKPVFVCVLFLSGLTFLFNNYILPYVSLQTHSLLWDIRQAKPSLNVKEGIFYNKIDDYSIRIGKKLKDGNGLRDIKIYDHTQHMGNTIQLYADSGIMSTSADTNFLILRMFNGNRYEDLTNTEKYRQTRPMMQLNFKELTVNIELTDFKLKRTEKELFKDHHEMMNVWQINSEIDTCEKAKTNKHIALNKQAATYFFNQTYNSKKKVTKDNLIKVRDFYKELKDNQFNVLIESASNIARTSSIFVESLNESIKTQDTKIKEFNIGWHEKINVCFACIVLFFVGAPLGAIIRKGGMGMPVVVAVFFFLAYFIFTEAFKGLTFEGYFQPWLGMWLSLFLFLPLGIFLTYKAATDSVLFDVDLYIQPIKRIFSRKNS